MIKRKKYTIALKRKVFKLYNEQNISVSSISHTFKIPRSSVYNILEERVKLTKTPRSDKGTTKTGGNIGLSKKQQKELFTDSDKTIIEVLKEHAEKLLSKVRLDNKITIVEEAKILEIVARIQKQCHEQELEQHIRRPDAKIIATMVRKYKPDASDMEVIKDYREAVEICKSL